MFIGFGKIGGNVLYSSNDYKVLHVTNSSIFNDSNNQPYDVSEEKIVAEAIQKLPVSEVQETYDQIGLRYPTFIVLDKTDRFLFVQAEVDKLEKVALQGFPNSPLSDFVTILKRNSSKNGEVALSSLFLCAKIDDNSILTFLNHKIIDSTAIKSKYAELNDNFGIDSKYASLDTKPDIAGVSFINETENIWVPFDDIDSFAKDLQKVRKRMNQANRLFSNYLVVPMSNTIRRQIRLATFSKMTIDEAMRKFECTKRSNTKLDSIQNCMVGMTNRAFDRGVISTNEIGKKFIFEIHKPEVVQTPAEYLPIDYVLPRISHMKIIKSQVNDKGAVQCLVEIVNEEVTDVTGMFYTSLEESGERIMITALPYSDVEKIINAAKLNIKSKKSNQVTA